MSSAPANPPLRFLVFGAGAIGAYIGGSLALSGQPVTFVERPEVAERLRASGLRLKILGESHHLEHPNVASSVAEALEQGPYDVGLFAVKSYDTAAALEGLRPLAANLPPLLCLQNGVDNEPAIAAVLGADKVLAGTVTTAIGRGAAGEIQVERFRGLGVAAGHPLSTAVVTALDGAGLNARLYPDAGGMKWSKMLTNLLANATSAILDLTPAQVFADPRLYRLEVEQLRETLRVMDGLGLRVVDLPGTPVRALAFAVRRLPVALSRPLLARSVGKGRGEKMPSFHIDLHSGRGHSEVDYLNGAVVRAGERLGIPTPVNRLLTDTLLRLTNGSESLETYRHQPQRLLAGWRG